MLRVHFVVILKNKDTDEIFLDTEIVEAKIVSKAKNYLIESYKKDKQYELLACKVGKLITLGAIERI